MAGQHLDPMAKQGAHCLLAVGSGWPKVGDLYHPLKGAAARDNLKPDGGNGLIGQRATQGLVACTHALNNFDLALGTKNGRPHLVFLAPYRLNDPCTLNHEFDDLVVIGVDLIAKGLQLLRCHPCSFSKRRI